MIGNRLDKCVIFFHKRLLSGTFFHIANSLFDFFLVFKVLRFFTECIK